MKVRPEDVSVDAAVFRNVVGHFASGVAVITTAHNGEKFGTTASAVSSLSMDPPMMLVCLNKSSTTHDAVVGSGVYAINILSEDQASLAYQFGKRGIDKFEGVAVTEGVLGVPLLDGALATIECVVEEAPVGGTHTVFFGRVAGAAAFEREPLAYFRGTMGRLERVKELAAYEGVRDWVLKRRTALHDELDVAAIAESLRTDEDQVRAALVKLVTEDLVQPTDDGGYVQVPITQSYLEAAYDGRAVIERGVLSAYFDKFTDEDKQFLQATADRIGELKSKDSSALDEFLALNAQFHNRIVAVTKSTQLTDAFRRLGIGTVWRQSLDDDTWQAQLDHTGTLALTEAITSGDKAAALAALERHTEIGKGLARDAIQLHGGEI